VQGPFHMVRSPERQTESHAYQDSHRTREQSQAFVIHYNEPGNILGVELAKCLQDGAIVAIQDDRVLFDVSPAWIPYDEKWEWRLPRGPFVLAMVGKARIYPVFIIRMGYRHYRIEAYEPLTKFQCCPTTDGAAAAVLCSEEFARKLGIENPVTIEAMSLKTDFASTFQPKSMIKMVGADMTAAAAKEVYEQSGLGPDDVDVIELHDCFTANELITYEGLGLCKEGEAGRLSDEDKTTYGGDWVVNPSGGLLSKGHPLGATGLAQCFELNQQLRGLAGSRQVEGARVALQHNLGLGGACVVTMYRKN